MDNLLYLCGIAGIIGGSAIKPAGRNGIADGGACHHRGEDTVNFKGE